MKTIQKSTWTLMLILVVSFSTCKRQAWEEFPEDEWTEDGSWDGNDEDNYEGEEGSLSLYDVNGNAISLNKEFSVSNDLQSYQQDKAKHNKMWEVVTTLVPQNDRSHVKQYEVFHGGGEVLGYVYPINDDIRTWVFGLDIYSAYPGEQLNADGEFVYTLIHEYGHILTLNDTQLDANANSCSVYDPGEGCSRSDAYIGEFWKRYWSDIWTEFQNAETNPSAAEQFYNNYSDRFVTDYASTNPAEDIAECFTNFILNPDPRPGNTIAEQKVGYFYEFPELIELRNHMRSHPEYMPNGSSKMISARIFRDRSHTCIRHPR